MAENRVFLLGSGFSKAVSREMPLMDGLSTAIVNRLREMGRAETDTPGISSPLASKKNFEQWLSFLVESPPWLSEVDRTRNRATFFEISRLVHSELLECQSRAVERGSCPEWLRRLVQYWDIESAKVITFNYDLLVELAWRVYGVVGRNYDVYVAPYPASITPIEAKVGRPAPSAPIGALQLLKLHGSLNWRYSGPDSPPGDIIYDLGINGRVYAETMGWNTESLRPRSYDEAEGWAADRDPMIVPPATVKSPYYNNRTLQELWTIAAEALRNARELVIMGFSLPQTDLLVSSLLMTNLRKDILITPVDYSDAIVKRISETVNTEGGNGARVNPIFTGLCGHALPSWVEASTSDQLTDAQGHRWEWRSSEMQFVMLDGG